MFATNNLRKDGTTMTKQDIIFLAAAQALIVKSGSTGKPTSEQAMDVFMHWHRLLSEAYDATQKQTAQGEQSTLQS
jgi:hypothetical protein